MAVLFITRAMNFNAVVAAGAGVVNQWTYTVPAGKRAEVIFGFCEVQDNANAVNTTIADIFINTGGTSITLVRQYNDGAGNNTLVPNSSIATIIPIVAGDTVVGRTQNTGAAGVQMIVRAAIKEYQ